MGVSFEAWREMKWEEMRFVWSGEMGGGFVTAGKC